jgi:hypothetical protein
MPSFRGWPTLSRGQQKTTQMDDKLLTGWAICPLSQKKILRSCAFLTNLITTSVFICGCKNVHVILAWNKI